MSARKSILKKHEGNYASNLLAHYLLLSKFSSLATAVHSDMETIFMIACGKFTNCNDESDTLWWNLIDAVKCFVALLLHSKRRRVLIIITAIIISIIVKLQMIKCRSLFVEDALHTHVCWFASRFSSISPVQHGAVQTHLLAGSECYEIAKHFLY